MRKDIHCTIGGVELLREEVEMMYSQKLYIVAYTGVYQILFSQAQDRYHGQKVYSEKYGNYEEEGKSMRDIVTEHYGEKGMKMILNLIG